MQAGNSDSDFINSNALIEPKARLSTTRLNIQRLEETFDT